MSLAKAMRAPATGRALDCEVAVIGAGVIGLAIAHQLALAGREVMLIDPAAPGSGASYGNAGTIADYAVQPVGTPGVLRDLPRLMFDRNSPLAIRQASLPSLAPWLLRFLRQSLPQAAARNAAAIAGLMAEAGPLWRGLAAEIGGSAILQERGCLYLYESRAGYQAASGDMAQRRSHGVAVELIGPSEVARLEPGLPPVAGGGAYFPGAIFLDDPGRMVGLLADAALGAGAALLTGRVTALARGAAPELTVETAEGTRRLRAGHVVIAAGAHSRALARMAGSRIPLDTERGYHLEYEMTDLPLSRPSCPTARGFYFCPMAGRLRVAGTVELGGLTAPPSPHRLARLDSGARQFFPDLRQPSRSWMGFRPSLPDSIPAIGPSGGGGDVLLAFGHGHVGLTLAPMTARIICDLIAGRAPGDLALPAHPGRF